MQKKEDKQWHDRKLLASCFLFVYKRFRFSPYDIVSSGVRAKKDKTETGVALSLSSPRIKNFS